jgi:hypothetical protein
MYTYYKRIRYTSTRLASTATSVHQRGLDCDTEFLDTARCSTTLLLRLLTVLELVVA